MRLKKRAAQILLQATLIGGSIVFAAPFLWLLSTSFKTLEEMFPVRWLPPLPHYALASPYVVPAKRVRVMRPGGVSPEAWPAVREAMTKAVAARVADLSRETEEPYRKWVAAPAVVDSVLAQLLARAPNEVLTRGADAAATWCAENVTATGVAEAFDAVFRRFGLSSVTVMGWNGVVEGPKEGVDFSWEVAKGPGEIAHPNGALLPPGTEVPYAFGADTADTLVVSTEVRTELDPDNVKRVGVTLRGDETWLKVKAVLEFGGRRYESVQSGYLGRAVPVEAIWQIPRGEQSDFEYHTWLAARPAGTSDFPTAGKIKISLIINRANYITRTIYKAGYNYREVLRAAPIGTYFRNSLLLVLLNVLGQIIGASLVAYAFSRLEWPGRDFYFVVMLATLMVPPQVTMVPVFLIFKELGWYNSLKPLWVTAFFGNPFFIFLLCQFMRGIPRDLEESARIDGCGYFGIYRRIILPLVKPALTTIGIFTFMAVWNDFMGPLIYVNDQRLYPLSLGLFALQAFMGTNYGLMMAASVLMTMPMIAVFLVAQRQFIEGVALTGMKG